MRGREKKYRMIHHEPEQIAKPNDGKLRVAAYCRVSTLSEEQELSFETQCSYYRSMLENSSDRILVGIYADQGMSGLRMENRTELQRLLEDCRKGLVNMVITKSVSRFSRNMSECQRTVDELNRLGIRIVFEKENIDTSDPASAFFLNILASLAQEESNSLSQNLRWSNFYNSEKGTPTRMACYGYRRAIRNGVTTKDWEIVPEEAEMIRQVFSFALKGYCYKNLAKKMNELEAERGGTGKWTYGRLYYTLRNEAYKGDILTNKVVKPDYISKKMFRNRGEYTQFYIEGHHEPIVQPEVFDRVGEMIRNGELDSRHWRFKCQEV
jgi:DNA invertase Pin-like site-specific DNA recombinase